MTISKSCAGPLRPARPCDSVACRSRLANSPGGSSQRSSATSAAELACSASGGSAALSVLSSGSDSETWCVAWRTTSDSHIPVLAATLRSRTHVNVPSLCWRSLAMMQLSEQAASE